MKGIKIGSVVFKEVSRQMDREINYFQVNIKKEVLYGEPYDPAVARPYEMYSIFFYCEELPEQWAELKDTNNDVFMNHLMGLYLDWVSLIASEPTINQFATDPLNPTKTEKDAYLEAISSWTSDVARLESQGNRGALFHAIKAKIEELSTAAQLITI